MVRKPHFLNCVQIHIFQTFVNKTKLFSVYPSQFIKSSRTSKMHTKNTNVRVSFKI
jgi:hypothetical protein